MSRNLDNTADREIITTRLLDAPRGLVFRMFTEPEHVVKWWGPNGFTNTNHEMDVKPGGVWRFIMHGPDGTDYGNKIVYSEVVRPERLVYIHGEDSGPGPGNPGNYFNVTITFEAQGEQTLVTMRAVLATVEEFERVKPFAVEGGKQTLGRLAAYLAAL